MYINTRKPDGGRLLVIGLGHRARQGKDTLARYLVKVLPLTAGIYHFATALKICARVEHGMVNKNPTLLQRIGHDKRQLDKDFWIRMLAYELQDEFNSAPPGDFVAIVPDMRYNNEMAWIQGIGGLAVKVTRTTPRTTPSDPAFDLDGIEMISKDRDPNHPSEKELENAIFDYEVRVGDGDLSGLRVESQALANQIMLYLNQHA